MKNILNISWLRHLLCGLALLALLKHWAYSDYANTIKLFPSSMMGLLSQLNWFVQLFIFSFAVFCISWVIEWVQSKFFGQKKMNYRSMLISVAGGVIAFCLMRSDLLAYVSTAILLIYAVNLIYQFRKK